MSRSVKGLSNGSKGPSVWLALLHFADGRVENVKGTVHFSPGNHKGRPQGDDVSLDDFIENEEHIEFFTEAFDAGPVVRTGNRRGQNVRPDSSCSMTAFKTSGLLKPALWTPLPCMSRYERPCMSMMWAPRALDSTFSTGVESACCMK